eukprot:12414059-Karenia_brevis.AAC.1
MRQVRGSQQNITGYFGGYISKAQPIGKFELKTSIATLPFLKKKLLERKSKASHQFAHVVNRMFTTLESKGIVRSHTQEIQLAADWNDKDVLSSDFFRAFRHADFNGFQFMKFAKEMVNGTPFDKIFVMPRSRFLSTYVSALRLY